MMYFFAFVSRFTLHENNAAAATVVAAATTCTAVTTSIIIPLPGKTLLSDMYVSSGDPSSDAEKC